MSRDGGNGPRLRLSADPTGEGTTACTRAQTLDHLATRAARWAAGAKATAVTGLVLTNAGLVLILTGFG
ncbi:hypothetical protein BBK14_04420 [Parafrankia soli]|uniref:Uncharacterized protein n=1 Tax=Parafrankia soli TaxID=2599596 RepID=A0A1S1Q204_9ACTN|nr:hypothetical protein [Parafrankia soli]OHV27142.1 hypothetical protein BBK14_04420 [Parafrankia soli]